MLKLGGHREAWNALSASAGNLLAGSNIEIVEGFLDDDAMKALYRRCDALLSPHRAEGFGLPMLEAMACGLPVIATGWSGNLEFMSPADSHLVPYRLTAVSDVSGIYRNSQWAEPDLEQAAFLLRRLESEPDHYAWLAAAAHCRVSGMMPSFPFSMPDAD